MDSRTLLASYVAVAGVAAAATVTALAALSPDGGRDRLVGYSTPACEQMLRPGEPVGVGAGVCVDRGGELRRLSVWRCVDGSLLVEVPSLPGVPAGWAVGGGPYRLVEGSEGDRAAAWRACRG